MSKLYLDGIDPKLRPICSAFSQLCGELNIGYSIVEDEFDRQIYVVATDDERLIDQMRALVEENNAFMIINGKRMIFATEQLDEDQYKSPTRKWIRQQSAFPSSMGKSRTFGGVEGYNNSSNKYQKRKRRKMDESCLGMVGKLKHTILAHDNATYIPKGSIIKIVDDDKSLPDVEYEGRIINVDRAVLEKAFKPNVFAEQLDSVLEAGDHEQTIIDDEPTDFEEKLTDIMADIRVKEPEVLFTIRP